MTPVAVAGRVRERSLDGLRGIAALVVVVHHALLCVPALAEPYYGGTAQSATSSVVRVLAWSPVHIVWAGGEAVFVFFVLSGYVLMRWQERGFSLAAYYPQRLARLYLPVIGAVAVVSVLVALRPPPAADGLGAWLPRHPEASASAAVQDSVLLLGPSGVNPPLWSLQFEVLYSLAAPVVGLVVLWWAAKARRWFWVPAVATLAFIAAMDGHRSIQLAAMFALGAALPLVVDRMRDGVDGSGRWWGLGALAVASLLLTAYWWPGVTNLVLPAAGAALLVVVAVTVAPVSAFLSARPVRWLGLISFSLYLIHEPIEVLLGYVLGPSNGAWVLPIGVPLSLAAAWVFWRFVEAPAHRLSRTVGRRVDSRRERTRHADLPSPAAPDPVAKEAV
jgi:peptidoglycan/LPS O-acetylase OafA/YrhL